MEREHSIHPEREHSIRTIKLAERDSNPIKFYRLFGQNSVGASKLPVL